MTDTALDVQASAIWYPVGPDGFQGGTIYGASVRRFESVRNAVRFLMEDVPAHQRSGAEVRAEDDKVYNMDEVAKIYRSPDFKKS